MKKLIKYLLSISLTCLLSFVVTPMFVSAEELTYGYNNGYTNWSTESTGAKGEISQTFYRYRDVLSWNPYFSQVHGQFWIPATQYGYFQPLTYSNCGSTRPSSGYYYYTYSSGYNYANCICSTTSYKSGYPYLNGYCSTTPTRLYQLCKTRTSYTTYTYYKVEAWDYDGVWNTRIDNNQEYYNSSGGMSTPRLATSRTAYLVPRTWNPWSSWNTYPYSSDNNTEVQSQTFYCHPRTTSPVKLVSTIYNGTKKTNKYSTPEGVTMTGENSGVNAGIYTATYTLQDGYTWDNGTTDPITTTLVIQKQPLIIPSLVDKTTKYTGSEQTAKVNYFNPELINQTGGTATNVGQHKVSWTLKYPNNYRWNDTSEILIADLDVNGLHIHNDFPLTGSCNGILYKNGIKFTGLNDLKYYLNGLPGTGYYNGYYYNNGVQDYQQNTIYIKDNKYYYNGALANGTYDFKLYKDGLLFTGTHTDGKYYHNGKSYTKGELIQIGGKEYRILNVNGTEIKVLAMYSYGSQIKFNSSSVTTSFNGTDGQKYADSNLDNQMTAFYNSLNPIIQNAIVAQDIKQSMYEWNGTPADISSWYKPSFTASDTSGTNYTLAKTAEINVGTRYVYALDVDDVKEYLGSNFTPQQLNTMFFNIDLSVNSSVWLRSTFTNTGCGAISGSYGEMISGNYSNSYWAYPAFVLDLSKLYETPSEIIKKEISLDENYVGYYADIDGDSIADGVIFFDYAHGATTDAGFIGNGVAVNAKTNKLADYTIIEVDGKKIVQKTSVGDDRFYVIALENTRPVSGSNSAYWYKSTYQIKVSDYDTIASTNFGTGRNNTANILKKWEYATFGDRTIYDLWSNIPDGWFVPSKDEWHVLGSELKKVSTGEYDSNSRTLPLITNAGAALSFNDYYWTSSLDSTSRVWWVYFNGVYGACSLNNNSYYVRVATTF